MVVLTVLAIIGLGIAAVVCLGTLFLVRFLDGPVSKVCAAVAACSLAFVFGYIALDFADDLRRPEISTTGR